ncbi:hypothetical protein F4677DRAFT_465192 [Hypoxylon crocopeplum]|nr:hypothetical protein F4677DRAFT_465192 [Hypoxylon crocopeplum]
MPTKCQCRTIDHYFSLQLDIAAAPSSIVSPQTNLQWQMKKIQKSGVDIHTVGCLLALGEVTPISTLFRKKLQNCHQKQRSQRWFLNAMLKYSSGKNFMVDQLLKTRAGEKDRCHQLAHEIGNLAYSIAKEYVEHRVYLGDMRHVEQGTPYFALHLDNMVNDLCKILHILGLPVRMAFVNGRRRIHFQHRSDCGRQLWNLDLGLFSRMVAHLVAHGCSSCPPGALMLRPEEPPSLPSFYVRCQLQKQMAIGAANSSNKYFQHIYFKSPRNTEQGISPAQLLLPPEIPMFNIEILGGGVVALLSGARIVWDRLEIPKQKLVGVDLDGMLLVSYRAVKPGLKPGPVFIIRNGRFSLEEEVDQF